MLARTVTRLIVHIGGQRTASDAIPRGLHANLEVLAHHGILVPEAGRLDMSPSAVRHHLLPWSFDPHGDHPHDPHAWSALADEITGSAASTVLLCSEVFTPVASDPDLAPQLMERLRGLADEVTVVYVAQEQLGVLAALYRQRVKALEVTSDFPTYLRESPDPDRYDLVRSWEPWYTSSEVGFVALPWSPDMGSDLFVELLTACGIDVPPEELAPPAGVPGAELGPIGIEAMRMLGAYLRGRFPDFRAGELASRRLRRKAAAALVTNGWCREEFWGWTPELAQRTVERYAGSNTEFAQQVWGSDWPLTSPIDRPSNAVEFVQLHIAAVDRVHRFLIAMEQSFVRLRARGSAA